MTMRRTLLLIVGIILITVGGMVPLTTVPVVFILPESFASTARIKVSMSDPASLGTEIEKIQSKMILYPIITNLNLNKKWAEKMKIDDMPVDLTYTLLRRQIEVRPGRGTTLISITVLSEDRNEAANIANETAKVYRDSPMATKASLNSPAVEIIDPAEPGLRPVRPNKVLDIGIACAVGALLAALGIVLMTFSRNRAQSPPRLS